jgi:hypothetical protein
LAAHFFCPLAELIRSADPARLNSPSICQKAGFKRLQGAQGTSGQIGVSASAALAGAMNGSIKSNNPNAALAVALKHLQCPMALRPGLLY